MPRKQHFVRLTRDDRRTLTSLVRTGHHAAWSMQRARILLAADAAADGRALTDIQVARQQGVSARTVVRARADWTARGIACVHRAPQRRPSRPATFSAAQTLEIAAITCTEPPPGYARWSLRLLRDRILELEIVESVCLETVRRALGKGGSSRGGRSAS